MKEIARNILLAALLLHPLDPLGWMPGTAALGQAAIICAVDGTIQHGVLGRITPASSTGLVPSPLCA